MLGTTPLVSISERRLGGIAYSSLPCFCAIRALELSTSRMVKPNCSRNARRFCPPENIGSPSDSWMRLHSSPRKHWKVQRIVPYLDVVRSGNLQFDACARSFFVTNPKAKLSLSTSAGEHPTYAVPGHQADQRRSTGDFGQKPAENRLERGAFAQAALQFT